MTTVDITGQLATYMAQARDMRLAPHVAQDAKHRMRNASGTQNCAAASSGLLRRSRRR
jgi:hypothetical protein